jgi:hypothetical protein
MVSSTTYLQLRTSIVVVVAIGKELEALELGHRSCLCCRCVIVTVALVCRVAIRSAFGTRTELAHALPTKVVLALDACHVVAAVILLDLCFARWTRSARIHVRNSGLPKHIVSVLLSLSLSWIVRNVWPYRAIDAMQTSLSVSSPPEFFLCHSCAMAQLAGR